MKKALSIYKIVTLFIISILSTVQGHSQTEVFCEEIKMYCPEAKLMEVIIKDEQSYKAFQDSSCFGYGSPVIDFEKYFLVGYKGATIGCKRPDYTYKAFQTGNDYTVKVEIVQYGNCKMLHIIRFWLLVPRIGSDIQVEFELNKTIINRENY